MNFILAHLGSFASGNWSEHLAAIDLARRYPNVYLETSSVVFTEYLELAAKEVPPEKLIFGSDGPLVDSRVELYKIRKRITNPILKAMVGSPRTDPSASRRHPLGWTRWEAA